MWKIPDLPVAAWEPPSYTVDDNGKVVGAEPGTPNNWGRWGEDDQRGTANLLTPERVTAAAALARTGKHFGLGLPVGIGGHPADTRPLPVHLWNRTTGDSVLMNSPMGLGEADDWIVMALQSSTQLDGLGHMSGDQVLYNGWWAGLVTAAKGAVRLGVHHVADGLCGRGVLLDVARHLSVEFLERGFAISRDLLDATAASQDVSIEPGDQVFVRTGLLHDFQQNGPVKLGSVAEPGLDDDCIGWLYEHDVALVAADNQAVQVIRPEPVAPTHVASPGKNTLYFHIAAIRDLGLYLGELLDLDELAADCGSDGVYEGFCVTSILPVVRGVGSPTNPTFIK
jgi:hypothetical protein